MFKTLNAWIESLLTVFSADANIPEKGRRVVFPMLNDANNPYFLVVSVNKTIDPTGRRQWNGQFRGRDGNTRNLDSDNPKCQTFHFYGDKNLYDWDKEESERNEQQRAQDQQKELVKAFEAEFKFKDGRPLRAYENKKLMVTVGPTAPGNLGAFSDEKLYVDRIDYSNKTVDMSMVGSGMEDLASELLGIPAADVVAGTTPTIAQNILVQPVEIVNPRFNKSLPVDEKNRPYLDREMGELINMTPILNRLAENGQVTLSARIFPHYQSRGMGGMEQYQRDLETYGAEMEEIPYSQQLNVETWKPRGAYTGTVTIHPPFDEAELRAELQAIAPGYRIKSGGGSLKVDNIYLFRSMMALGARGPEVAESNWLRPKGVPETPSQGVALERPPQA